MFLSIMGMYEYDPSIFGGLDIPTYTDQDNTVHVINKQNVIDNICLNCAEMEILYPSFDTMKLAIGVWSAANQETWRKLLETQFIQYNPIWNVDAHELETYGRGYTDETSYDSQDKRTVDLTDETTYDSQDKRTVDLTDKETRDMTDTKSVMGFNSNTWAESEKMVYSGTDTFEHDGTDTHDFSGSDTTEHDGTDTIDYSGKDTRTGREDSGREVTRQGNIGVTTTQKMIEEQREIAEFNIIDYITESFKKRFCLMIY